jgi:arsenate reductase
MKKRKVLFLCAGNSCRSQMAEAIVNTHLAARWRAFSAGVSPAEKVHPMVPRVLAESRVPFNGKPKSADRYKGVSFDLVVTLCDSAKRECPVWLGSGERLHRDYADPGLVEGTEEKKLAAFRKLRDDMLTEIPYLLERHESGKMNV